ncbi:thioredoxin domain-containing protein [bacterium]|nr:thioredoxin domain-containing protein [bacterium]
MSVSHHPFTNHLIDASSPYLLSHAHNPVNWYPWCDDALEMAKKETKPIFLSIGYAACHWCHVMERESFEDPQIAEVLNEHYVSIKVDREERPDLDHIYMSFTQALTGSGGWPMSVFLTPDLKPFFAGTYFPPQDAMGRPGFLRVISEIAKAWYETRSDILESSEDIHSKVSTALSVTAEPSGLTPDMITRGAEALLRQTDPIHGGIGTAPKFPHATEVSLFLRTYRASGDLRFLQAAEKALLGMANGGIFDHLGGGFARYSVDQQWLVPHFEKMLYDNGLLVTTYAEAYQVTHKEFYLDIIRRTLDFMLRELADTNGGFYSALDADSEGEEGKFYVWSKSEIEQTLGADADEFCRYYNVTDGGNFEGHNILHIDTNSDRVRQNSMREDFDGYLAACREKLFELRSARVRPLTDDKVLTSWNGLALSALARGYQVTGDVRYLEVARKNASFVHGDLFRDGHLTHAWREGRHSEGQFLEDYAYYVRGLIDLYESDPSDKNTTWLTFAMTLSEQATALFMDDSGQFFLRPGDQADLIMRPRDEHDGALPAVGSIMIHNLQRLSHLTGNEKLGQAAEKALRAISGTVARIPNAMASALAAVDFHLNEKVEIVVIGDSATRDAMLQEIYRSYLPNRVIAVSSDGSSDLPLFEGRTIANGDCRVYVCRNAVCGTPADSVEELREQMRRL